MSSQRIPETASALASPSVGCDRRSTLLAVAAALSGCVAPPVRAATTASGSALPCADRPGDIVGLLLEGRGAPAGTVSVFGQAFRPGNLPRDRRLGARLADGRPVPVQLDVTGRHPDGSAKFGIVSLAPTVTLLQRQSLGVVLTSAAPADTSPALDLSAALAGRQILVEVAPSGQAAPWRVDLAEMLRQSAARAAGATWQNGPLATQRRISLPVPGSAVGGASSMRLVADVAVYSNGTLLADVWLRNDVAMRPGGGPASYTLRVNLDGREALRAAIPRHHHYTGWGRALVAAPGGAAAPTPAFVRHDAGFLADAGAVARYDLSVPVSEAVLAGFAQAITAPAWNVPFSPRGITQGMPGTGGRADIGPATLYQAAWLVSGDPRAAVFAVGQAEAAGGIPWHHWDMDAANGAGGWLDVQRWPRIWVDGRGGPPPGGLLQPVPGTHETGWEHDHAHQPDLAFVPFLLTGRRAFLDELKAQAAWNIVGHWSERRGDGQGNLINGNQTRGAAWALRQVHEAAWISPDDDPQRAYFGQIERNNLRWLVSQIPAWTRAQGEAHGWVPGEYDGPFEIKPWMQDHLASTLIAMARKGDEDARIVLGFMSNFLLGRFLSADLGFNPRDGGSYVLAGTNAEKVPLRTWREMGRQTAARGWSSGNGWGEQSQGNYNQVALTTLAGLVDLFNSPSSRRAYDWLVAAGAPYTGVNDFARDPTYSVVPKNAPRVPSRMPACARSPAPAAR